MTASKTLRAPFRSDLNPLREFLPNLIPILESQPGWYGSLYYERKSVKNHMANLKQTNLSDSLSEGIVLRIYDGYTLFEQASDELDSRALERLATSFAERVAKTVPPEGATRRVYAPPSWTERLKATLDPEIRDQIPAGASARTPVHFGIRYLEGPHALGDAEVFARLKVLMDRVKARAVHAGLTEADLTFLMTRQYFGEEEAIFIDRESNLSQTLYRTALLLMAMSGPHRVYERPGGLGGLEIAHYPDEEIDRMLSELASLRNAERLEPGKYRVLLGPVITGILAHEAFGHAQEADTCVRGRSKAWELQKSGELVGNEHATILNNPAIFQNADQPYAAWGSYFFDEEGWLAGEQVLLEKGRLREPMTNLTSAIRLEIPRTANGKRESWSHGVYTRQTNTYFSAGTETLDQLMKKIDHGFLATAAAGGMEDPKGMGIQVGIAYLQEVKAGKLTGRVFRGPAGGDVQLTGYVPDVLNSIVAKSKIDFTDPGADRSKHPVNDAGGCGKYHKEYVVAGCGGPYLLLDQATLG